MENNSNKKQIIILIVLLIILIIAIIANFFVWSYKAEPVNTITPSNIAEEESENIISNTNVQNKISNIINNETNTSEPVVVNLNEDINMDELKEFFERYSLGIQRISFDEENLESNTILLFIAKEYFDTNSNKNSLNVDTNYAPTLENIHKYLTELTGKDYSNIKYLKSYNNYIGYASSSNSYIYGKDYELITREKYKCTEATITNDDNGLYTAVAKVTRTLNKQDTNYELTFTFTLNSGYTYEKYCVKSLKVKNTSFYPDNTIHFIPNSVEEDENN